MNFILFAVVAIGCFYIGVREYNATEQSRIFTKYPIRVNDVKAYNQFCGKLIMGFGIAAMFTLMIADVFDGFISLIMVALLIVEGVALMKIYRKGEKKYRIK